MDLLQETFTETLDAGAPSIKYEGDIQQEQKVARTLWDQLPNQVRMRFGSFEQFFQSGAWKKVLEAVQQQQQMQAPEQIQETEVIQEQAPQQGLGSMMPAQMAYGGVAGPDGRRAYGWGSKLKKAFKKVTKPFKKIVKSPIGKAAAVYGLGTLAGGSPWFTGGGWDISKGSALNLFKPGEWSQSNPLSALVRKGITETVDGKKVHKWGGASLAKILGAGATGLGALYAAKQPQEQFDKFDMSSQKFDFDYGKMRQEIAEAASTGDQDQMDIVLAKYNLSSGDMPGQKYWKTAAQGGRIGYDVGGPADQLEKALAEDDIAALEEPFSLPPLELLKLLEEIRAKKRRAYEQRQLGMTGIGAAQGGRIGALEGGLLKKVVPRKYSVGERREYYNTDPDYGDDSLLSFPPTWIAPSMIAAIMSAGPKKEKKKSVADPKSMRGMGRIKKQEGGLMSLGGMEMDLRGGGFVPLGAKEKADDVPARLSKNEFVFTADAVRAAGGGDVDAGADKMYNTMKQLENRVGS